MSNKIAFMLVILPVVVIFAGCTTYLPGKLPSGFIEGYSNYPTKNNVSVAVKIFDCESASQVFDCEICQKGIQPIFIVIDNKSEDAYLFTKESVNSDYIPADSVGRKCARSARSCGIWPPAHVRNHKINVLIEEDYAKKEIQDGPINPKQGVSGVIFINAMQKGYKLVVPLVNRETKEKILFEFTKD